MPILASVSLSVQIPTTPNFSVAWTIRADAYDRASVTVTKGKTGTLELQPGKATEVLLLVITSSDYTGNVTFNFGAATWPITEPQIVAGTGLMNAITHSGNPNTVVFDNSAGGGDVNIDVLVIRTAVTIA